jgi:hypothetical protein
MEKKVFLSGTPGAPRERDGASRIASAMKRAGAPGEASGKL